MTMLCDWQIADLIRDQEMISPAVFHQVRDDERKGRIVSYGLSSAGYDIRLGDIFSSPTTASIGDPHNVDAHYEARSESWQPVLLTSGHHLLGVSMERFKIPANIIGICVGKSTYARLGIIVNVTPLEPGWEGYLTIEIHNASARPVRVYPGEGIAQIMFHRISEPDVTYRDRGGKYQNQPNKPVESKL